MTTRKKSRKCPNCEYENQPNAKLCVICDTPMDWKKRIMDTGMRSSLGGLLNKVSEMTADVPAIDEKALFDDSNHLRGTPDARNAGMKKRSDSEQLVRQTLHQMWGDSEYVAFEPLEQAIDTNIPAKEGNTIIRRNCPDCGNVNQAGVFICEDCGMSLVDSQPMESALPVAEDIHFEGTTQPERPGAMNQMVNNKLNKDSAISARPSSGTLLNRALGASEAKDDTVETDNPMGRTIIDEDIPVVVPSGTPNFRYEEGMNLKLSIDEVTNPFVFPIKDDGSVLIGRQYPNLRRQPDWDVTPYLPANHGVSRQHALLQFSGNRIELRDLKSTNGTFLNEIPFGEGETHQIRDGDVIRLGNFSFTATFQYERVPSEPDNDNTAVLVVN